MEAFPMLTLGNLPSVKELQALSDNGIFALVNLSGRQMNEIYPKEVVCRFQRHDFDFEDVFSQDDLRQADWERFQREHLSTVMRAVDRLGELLMSDYAVHCFCHQGISRSSLVAAGALVHTYGLELPSAMDIVKAKNGKARFSEKSLWFLNWLRYGDTKAVS